MAQLTTKQKRSRRTRARIRGTKERPRLSVFRSNAHVYAQLIDDTTGETILSAHSKEFFEYGSNIKAAERVGEEVAKRAKEHNIQTVVFDRGPYRYHGRVKALADAARKGGLEF